MFNINREIWAGTEQSLSAALAAEHLAITKMKAGFNADSAEVPSLLSVQGSVGMVSIRGPIFNSALAEMFGLTTYAGIRRAMVAAVNDPAVEKILLAVDSGGGTVSGVYDTAQMISTVNAKVKPVTAMAGDTMASAAYWLGSAASKVYSGQMSMVGSIGVIGVHKEYSKQLAADGVTVTVLRAGKYKALANPVEPLSSAAEAQMQAHLDAVYQVFVEAVAAHRGVTPAQADKMAQGREFFGQAALDAGLVDGITTLGAVVGGLQKK